MTPLVAAIRAKALYGLLIWLAGAVAAGWVADRKGYGEKVGLASALVLLVFSPLAAVVWLLWPAKAESAWKTDGPLGRRSRPAG